MCQMSGAFRKNHKRHFTINLQSFYWNFQHIRLCLELLIYRVIFVPSNFRPTTWKLFDPSLIRPDIVVLKGDIIRHWNLPSLKFARLQRRRKGQKQNGAYISLFTVSICKLMQAVQHLSILKVSMFLENILEYLLF